MTKADLNDFSCKTCGSLPSAKTTGLTTGLFCTKCDKFIVLTSLFSFLTEDNTNYVLSVAESEINDPALIDAIAQIIGKGPEQAQEFLKVNGPKILEANAYDIKMAEKVLNAHNIKFEIQPPFPYLDTK